MMSLQHLSGPAKLWLAAAASAHDDGASEGRDGGIARAAGKRQLRVLIVEDEFFISLHTKELLQAMGHVAVAVAVSAEQAVAFAERERPDVVLMDIRLMGARDGIAAAEEIRSKFGISSIFVTANTDAQTRARAEAVRPVAFLQKPLTEERLRLGLSRIGEV
jgi:CheY-like chemotaxis protein